MLFVDNRTCSQTLAEAIRKRAHQRGWSLNQVADFAGVSRSGLRAILAGEYLPNLGWLLRVADALGCKPSQLVP